MLGFNKKLIFLSFEAYVFIVVLVLSLSFYFLLLVCNQDFSSSFNGKRSELNC